MHDEQELAETAIAADLFGSAGLAEDGPPPAPERYAIIRALGRGGGGEVFLARDTQLGRSVALKYLSQDRPAELERFFREARFVARLNNPSIVQVYEAGEIDGYPYLVMQYVPGGNLASATLDIQSTVHAMRQVAAALAHAHREGIVHRDIKPENILLDLDGRAYLTDFGIARDLRSELGATISQDGQILGTPGLMAPEQARGEVHAVDARSDIYALGATLYWKTVGQPPFVADHLVDLLHLVIHEDPPFPRRYNGDIPRDLEAIILRCMSKRREERFQSMTLVIDALDRYLHGRERREVSPRWFTSYVRQQVNEAPAPSTVLVDLERDWLPALEVAQEIAAWDTQLYRVRGDLVRHFPRLDAVISRLDHVLDQQPAIGWARFYRGVAWFRRGELRRALEDMERSIDRVRDLSGAYLELGRLYLALHFSECHAAEWHLSRVGAEDQVRAAHTRIEQAAIAFEEARRLKQDLPAWQMRYADAVLRLASADVEGALSICDEILADDPDLEEVWKLKGDVQRGAGLDPLASYARATEIRRSNYDVWVAMAEVHLAAGRGADARSCLTRALDAHSELAAAQVLLARTELVDARATGTSDGLALGVELAARVHEKHPHRHDAAITLAELQIEMARASQRREWIGRALDTLDRAVQLDGCGNRVNYLQARARLERARLAAAAGEDARADVDAVLSMREDEGAQVPDNAPWLDLFAEAERMRATP
ncbi:MAG: protein kinase [Luteitalea sp.]|nr:protein kinase [Luteitalea sp.]